MELLTTFFDGFVWCIAAGAGVFALTAVASILDAALDC
jgi:hypothetical protein